MGTEEHQVTLYVYYRTGYGVNCINSVTFNVFRDALLTGEEDTASPHAASLLQLTRMMCFTCDSKGKWLLGDVDIKVSMHRLEGVSPHQLKLHCGVLGQLFLTFAWPAPECRSSEVFNEGR